MEKSEIKDNLYHFSENYSAANTKNYWALEKEEILTIAIFVLLSFF